MTGQNKITIGIAASALPDFDIGIGIAIAALAPPLSFFNTWVSMGTLWARNGIQPLGFSSGTDVIVSNQVEKIQQSLLDELPILALIDD